MEMKELIKIPEEELEKVFKEHTRWLSTDEDVGARANLSYADLRGAHLKHANLEYAELRYADLRYAELRYADLRYADLSDANLKGANLRGADLRGADLRDADLRDADLRDAILRGADLRGTKYFVPSVCPTEGSFIAWKKAIARVENVPVIIKLQIPEDALRSSGASRKCRASKVIVLDIQTLEGESLKDVTACSSYNFGFIYEIGKTVEPDSFDEDRFNECSNGIHFFMDCREAIEYIL